MICEQNNSNGVARLYWARRVMAANCRAHKMHERRAREARELESEIFHSGARVGFEDSLRAVARAIREAR